MSKVVSTNCVQSCLKGSVVYQGFSFLTCFIQSSDPFISISETLQFACKQFLCQKLGRSTLLSWRFIEATSALVMRDHLPLRAQSYAVYSDTTLIIFNGAYSEVIVNTVVALRPNLNSTSPPMHPCQQCMSCILGGGSNHGGLLKVRESFFLPRGCIGTGKLHWIGDVTLEMSQNFVLPIFGTD